MGVSIVAYKAAVPTGERFPVKDNGVPEGWPENEDHTQAFAYAGFEQSLDGLTAGDCYEVTDPKRMGDFSYSGYGRWRADLCRTILGVEPEAIWGDVDAYRDRPFFELIHFADNEGTIGPAAAGRLAEDFAAHRAQYVAAHDTTDAFERHVERYDDMAAGFAHAAAGGLVEFR